MKHKKWLARFLCVAMGLSLLSGCKSNDSSVSSSGGEVSSDGYKDTITLAVGSDQNYMDGQMNNTNDLILRACYSQLVRRNADNEIVGDLAEDWSVSEDGCTWTFNLRKDVKFHSGKQFTAADVKASYDRLLDTEKPVRYSSLVKGYVSECNVVDEYTVELVSEKPIAAMLANLCHRCNLILNADYIEQYGTELGLTAESVDGTGPYTLASWNPGEEMILERYDDYFRGPVPTKTVDILVVPDANARRVALETGDVDATIVAVNEIPALRERDDVNVLTFESVGSYGLQFNCANEYMADPRLRQAVSYAINRQEICDTLWSDVNEKVSTAPVNPNVWGYTNLGVIEQDQEKAKQLMADAGYPDGFEMAIMVSTSYSKSLEATEMIVSDLAEIGIRATIEPVDGATFTSYMGNRSYPGENFPFGMLFMGFGAGTADCDEGLRRIWTTSPDGNNNNNYGWYSNERVDELLADAAVEMDEEKRLAMYEEAQKILFLEDPAAIWLHDGYNVWCTSSKVEGFKLNVNMVIMWDELRCKA